MKKERKFPHMKKNIQYSHYCGTELLEIVCALDNAIFEDAENWINYAKKMTEQLRDKIAELDVINEMKY